VSADAPPLVIVGVIASAIAAFFYVRVIVLMFFADPAPDGPTVAIPSGMTVSAISIVTVISVVLGLFPQPFIDLAEQAGVFLR
jgi:NADH-quinone oxidoreductase subunit N